jgi:hypothetical protein
VRRLFTAGLVLAVAAPAAAQPLTLGQPPAPTSDPRPVGSYEGVEPGEPKPPPAYDRVMRQERRHAETNILTWPGFTPRPDGGSRFFVQTTDPATPAVSVEEGRIVVLFRNARVHVRNSTRWLETEYFDTPVRRARLERRGHDMAFVLYLRAPATPRVSTAPATDGGAPPFYYLYIDFPPGQHAPVAGSGATPPGPPPAPARELDPSLRALDDERPPSVDPAH